jgi:hypothetical protein
LTQQLDFRLSDFPSSVSTSRISDRSFGISFLRTGAPTEIFRIDHLVFRFCEQAHRRRYFGSIIWYFVFANMRTDGCISDRSFGISFLRTGAPTEVFQIDLLIFWFPVYIFRSPVYLFRFPVYLFCFQFLYFGSAPSSDLDSPVHFWLPEPTLLDPLV